MSRRTPAHPPGTPGITSSVTDLTLQASSVFTLRCELQTLHQRLQDKDRLIKTLQKQIISKRTSVKSEDELPSPDLSQFPLNLTTTGVIINSSADLSHQSTEKSIGLHEHFPSHTLPPVIPPVVEPLQIPMELPDHVIHEGIIQRIKLQHDALCIDLKEALEVEHSKCVSLEEEVINLKKKYDLDLQEAQHTCLKCKENAFSKNSNYQSTSANGVSSGLLGGVTTGNQFRVSNSGSGGSLTPTSGLIGQHSQIANNAAEAAGNSQAAFISKLKGRVHDLERERRELIEENEMLHDSELLLREDLNLKSQMIAELLNKNCGSDNPHKGKIK